jgi:hypothetical protein
LNARRTRTANEDNLPEIRAIKDPKRECQELIPKEEQAEYMINSLPELIRTGALKTKGDWENYQEGLKIIPAKYRNVYTLGVAANFKRAGMLENNGGWRAYASEYSRSIDPLDAEETIDYTTYVMPALIKSGALSDNCWDPHARNFKRTRRLIPERDWKDYVESALPSLIMTGKIRTEEEWGEYQKSLGLVREDNRLEFTWNTLTSLANNRCLEKRSDWVMHAKKYSKSTRLIPEDHMRNYNLNALDEIIKRGFLGAAREWDDYIGVMKLLPAEDRVDVTWFGLPTIKDGGFLETSGDWKSFRKCLNMVPEKRRLQYIKDALSRITKKDGFSWEYAIRQTRLLCGYHRKYGDLDFLWKTGFENLDILHHADSRGYPLEFEKDGGSMRVMDGRMGGVIYRTMTKTAFDEWVKAEEAGIPCEKIIRYPVGHSREGKPRAFMTKKGEVIVACLYGGQDIPEFLRNPKNRRYEGEVIKQMKTIEKRLDDEGIRHDHTHPNNFVVSWEGGKPFVRVIDFDEGISHRVIE